MVYQLRKEEVSLSKVSGNPTSGVRIQLGSGIEEWSFARLGSRTLRGLLIGHYKANDVSLLSVASRWESSQGNALAGAMTRRASAECEGTLDLSPADGANGRPRRRRHDASAGGSRELATWPGKCPRVHRARYAGIFGSGEAQVYV